MTCLTATLRLAANKQQYKATNISVIHELYRPLTFESLCQAIIYALKPGVTSVGRPDAKRPQTIKLIGLNMSQEHVVITNTDGVVAIKCTFATVL
jgi:hypothetical protein